MKEPHPVPGIPATQIRSLDSRCCIACGDPTPNPERLCNECAIDFDESRVLTVHACAVDRVEPSTSTALRDTEPRPLASHMAPSMGADLHGGAHLFALAAYSASGKGWQ